MPIVWLSQCGRVFAFYASINSSCYCIPPPPGRSPGICISFFPWDNEFPAPGPPEITNALLRGKLYDRLCTIVCGTPGFRTLVVSAVSKKYSSFMVFRVLEIAFPSIWISKFSGGACPQTPLEGGTLRPRHCTAAYFSRPSAYFRFYWKPWESQN